MIIIDTQRRLPNGTVIDVEVLESYRLRLPEQFTDFTYDVIDYLQSAETPELIWGRWIVRLYKREGTFRQDIVSNVYHTSESFVLALQSITQQVIRATHEGGFVSEGIESGADLEISANDITPDGEGFVIIRGFIQT